MSAIRQSRTLQQWTSAFSSQSVRFAETPQTPLTAVVRVEDSVLSWTAGQAIGQYTAVGLNQIIQGDH
jgi:hypothetical protein